ncbi:malate dehydrogenase [Sulfuricurvum sp.]|uniref:malate dehydrogenase n=1 Tax=Sulfuricurvum sp. TaxID=2025608 RepID=UPI003BB6EDC6
MGYRPLKNNAIIQLRPRKISYTEGDRTITLISMKRASMDLEVEIKEGDEIKIVSDFPFAHLPKKIKKEINPL